LIKKRDEAQANVDGKGTQYTKYAREQRAIAYGTCAGVCIFTTTLTGGASCVACYAAAAATVETLCANFREKNKELKKEYEKMSKEVDVVLDRIKEIIEQIILLDMDVLDVANLIENALLEYEDIELFGQGEISWLTEDAAEPEGRF